MAVFQSLPPPIDPTLFSENLTPHSVVVHNLMAKYHVPLIQTCEVLRDFLPTCVSDHHDMPMHIHLDLPTSPTSALKPSSQSSPPHTLYHSKRL